MDTLLFLVFFAAFLAIPFGLINPKWFQGLFDKTIKLKASRVNVTATLFATAFASALIGGAMSDTPPSTTKATIEAENTESVIEEEVVISEMEADTFHAKESTPSPEPVPTEPSSYETTTASDTYEYDYAPETVYEPAPEPTYEPEPQVSANCSGNIYNCGDFSTHAQAQAMHDTCMTEVGYDVHRLDGNDNDGLACESLP